MLRFSTVLQLTLSIICMLFSPAPAFDGFVIALENHYSDRLESVDIMEQLTTWNPNFLVHTQYPLSLAVLQYTPSANFDFWILEKLDTLQIHLFKLPCGCNFYQKKSKAESTSP